MDRMQEAPEARYSDAIVTIAMVERAEQMARNVRSETEPALTAIAAMQRTLLRLESRIRDLEDRQKPA